TLKHFSRLVTKAAKAKNPDKPLVGHAEKPAVQGVQSSGKYETGSEERLLLAIGAWTGAIAALVCLALLAGQHHYLRGALPEAGGAADGLLGGLVVGLVGGAAGPGVLMLAPGSVLLAALSRGLAWSR